MILGIDLGATNTVGCVWDGKLRMIEITSGGATSLPSVVTIANGEALVGQAAIEAGRQFPDYQFRLWKRTMAERWHEDEDTGYQTCKGEDGMLAYRGPDGFTYSPIELSALIIAEIVRAANEYLAPHDSVTGAVIGIPATFTPDQIEAVKTAAALAAKVVTSIWPSGAWTMTPCGMPFSRMRRVNARVSIPVNPTMFFDFNQASSEISDRQLEGRVMSARIIAPRAPKAAGGEASSSSSPLVPVLPIWGAVKAMI
jgi:hypothetical protein